MVSDRGKLRAVEETTAAGIASSELGYNVTRLHFHLQESGLSEWLGQQFLVLKDFSPEAMALIIAIVVAAFTEITSNTSTASIFLPILAALVCLTIYPKI